MREINFILALFIASLLAAFVFTLRASPVQIATVDVNAIIKSELTHVARMPLSQPKKIARIKAFNRQLTATLDHYANVHHLILLAKPAVLSEDNAPNVTQDILQQLHESAA